MASKKKALVEILAWLLGERNRIFQFMDHAQGEGFAMWESLYEKCQAEIDSIEAQLEECNK